MRQGNPCPLPKYAIFDAETNPFEDFYKNSLVRFSVDARVSEGPNMLVFCFTLGAWAFDMERFLVSCFGIMVFLVVFIWDQGGRMNSKYRQFSLL